MLRRFGMLTLVLTSACGGGRGRPLPPDAAPDRGADAPQGDGDVDDRTDVPAEPPSEAGPEAPETMPESVFETPPAETPEGPSPEPPPLPESKPEAGTEIPPEGPATEGPFPGDCATAFAGGPTGSGLPKIVYPLEGSMHPRNFANLNLQFFTGGQSLFRLRMKGASVDRTICFVPTKCDADRCQYTIPASEWTGALADAKGSSFALTVDGTAAPGMPVASSTGVDVTASDADFAGLLYYFSTSLPGVVRATDVNGKAAPFITPASPSNPKDCAGCHDVSLDGKRITATYGHGDDFLGIASAAAPSTFTAAVGSTRSNFKTFSPDGARLLDNFNGALVLRDGASGAKIAAVPTPERAVMPSWSHKGDRVVYVELLAGSNLFYDAATCCGKREGGDWLVTDAGRLVTLDYMSDTFSGRKVVLDAKSPEFHYYPAFSPDDAWLVFNTGTKPGFSPIAQDDSAGFSYGVPKDQLVSYDQQTSRLRMVRSDGSAAPIELARATVMAGETTSYPRVAPFTTGGGEVFWITFASKMDYGFVVTGGKLPQLWMAAIDTSKAGDPSSAPFWLTVQDEKEANHSGLWRP